MKYTKTERLQRIKELAAELSGQIHELAETVEQRNGRAIRRLQVLGNVSSQEQATGEKVEGQDE